MHKLSRQCRLCFGLNGSCSNEAAITRVIGALLGNKKDEWATSRRYMSLETLATLSDTQFVSLHGVVA